MHKVGEVANKIVVSNSNYKLVQIKKNEQFICNKLKSINIMKKIQNYKMNNIFIKIFILVNAIILTLVYRSLYKILKEYSWNLFGKQEGY
jgi:hypothetical protein